MKITTEKFFSIAGVKAPVSKQHVVENQQINLNDFLVILEVKDLESFAASCRGYGAGTWVDLDDNHVAVLKHLAPDFMKIIQRINSFSDRDEI